MRLVAITTLALCALPATAPAATISGKTYDDGDGTTLGTMKFRASPGVANRIVVEAVAGLHSFRVTDRAERVRASGDCDQDGRHSAICPWTESDHALEMRLGGRGDRVLTKGSNLDVLVRGGNGDDVLRGSGDELFGDRGDDVLRGGRGWDRLHAGPGRDHVDGRGAGSLDDIYYDDETDGQAARDTYLALPSNRAELHYSKRTRDLRIDLHDQRIAPERDLIDGVKSLMGGSGDDVFIGTGGRNRLQGGPGDDRLFGRLGPDHLSGGQGNDRMFGEDGDDWLTEGVYWDSSAGGRDRYVGGAGRDDMVSLDSLADDEVEADEVSCDAEDQAVESDPQDRLHDCLRVRGWDVSSLDMATTPQLTTEGAAFHVLCGPTESEQVSSSEIVFRCHGRLIIRSAAGEEYGSREFSFDVEFFPMQTEQTVTVPLTDAGRAAIQRGDLVIVEAEALSSNGFDIPSAGYRAPIG